MRPHFLIHRQKMCFTRLETAVGAAVCSSARKIHQHARMQQVPPSFLILLPWAPDLGSVRLTKCECDRSESSGRRTKEVLGEWALLSATLGPPPWRTRPYFPVPLSQRGAPGKRQ